MYDKIKGIIGVKEGVSLDKDTKKALISLVRKSIKQGKNIEVQVNAIDDILVDGKKWLQGAGKLVGNLNLESFVKKIGDYEVFENGEVFYRGISQADFDILKTTGKLPPTSETFTSPTLEYIKAVGYGINDGGKIIKFQMKTGTLEELKKIGLKNDATPKITNYYPDMLRLSNTDDWTMNNALFKTEGKKYVDLGTLKEIQVNIGLGKGKALIKFNENISTVVGVLALATPTTNEVEQRTNNQNHNI